MAQLNIQLTSRPEIVRPRGYKRVGRILLGVLIVDLLSGQLVRFYGSGLDSLSAPAVTYISNALRLFPRPTDPKT